MLKILPEPRDREKRVFVLVTEHAPYEEATKAIHLAITGIVDTGIPEKQ